MIEFFLFLFYILAGVVTGSALGGICRGIPALSWLGHTNTIGFSAANPAVLDLIVIKVTFGFAMTVSVAQIITIAIALYIYRKTR